MAGSNPAAFTVAAEDRKYECLYPVSLERLGRFLLLGWNLVEIDLHVLSNEVHLRITRTKPCPMLTTDCTFAPPWTVACSRQIYMELVAETLLVILSYPDVTNDLSTQCLSKQ